MNTLGGARIRWWYVICEHSQIGGGPRQQPPPPLIAGIIKVTISYKHAHIDTQAQTCTQTNTDVLRSSWYFLGFFRGPNFSCAAPFNLSKGVQLVLVPWWCSGISHLNKGSIVFFNGSLYEARSQVPGVHTHRHTGSNMCTNKH